MIREIIEIPPLVPPLLRGELKGGSVSTLILTTDK